jgi:hypothetical protein
VDLVVKVTLLTWLGLGQQVGIPPASSDNRQNEYQATWFLEHALTEVTHARVNHESCSKHVSSRCNVGECMDSWHNASCIHLADVGES